MSNRKLALFLAPMLLTGCSLVFNGTSQEVSFTSDPPGATFTVAGQTAVTPATLTLPKDDCVAVFTKIGHKDQVVELKRKVSTMFYFNIPSGVIASVVDIVTGAWKEFENDKIHAKLPVVGDRPELVPVEFQSDPGGAIVSVDDTEIGTTPLKVSLPWKVKDVEKTIVFRLPEYKTKSLPLRREMKTLSAPLEPEPVMVRVKFDSRPAGAEVWVDGRIVGTTPVAAEFPWIPGSPPRGVEFRLEGYHAEQRELTRRLADLAADLREKVDVIPVSVRTNPPGALIEVVGTEIVSDDGTVPLSWSLSTRSYTLRIIHPGCVTRTIDVTRADTAKGLDLRLVPFIAKPR